LAETFNPAPSQTVFSARSKERVSAANTVIRITAVGVSSRLSKPSVSRNGKKSLATRCTIALQLLQRDGPVYRSYRAFDGKQVAPPAAPRTRSLGDLGRHYLRHLTLLNLPAQLLSQFVSTRFNDRVMRYPLNGAIGSV